MSGLYTRSELGRFQIVVVETVRLDVDGWFPQMMASGTHSRVGYLHHGSVDWLAYRLEETSEGVWEGKIVRRWGDIQLLPHDSVRIHVPRRHFVWNAKMTITFTGGAPDIIEVLEFES